MLVGKTFRSFFLRFSPAIASMQLLVTGCLTPEKAEKGADESALRHSAAAWEKGMGVTNVFGIAYEGDPIAPLVPDTNGIVRLSLNDALRVGAKNNRQFRTHKETVFIRALALDTEEYAFSTTFSGMILGALSGNPELAKESARAGGDSSLVSRKFEQGAVMTGNAAVDIAKMIRDDWHSFGWTGGITMSIPLLRGAGRDIVREPLTQAERNLVYSIWTFERYRQTFSLSLAKAYFNVLKYYQNHLNSADNVKRLEQNYSRAEMMFKAGRMDRIQTDQAKTDLLNARQTMITTKQSYQDALDDFKVTLGLSPEMPIELSSDELRSLEQRMEKLAEESDDALSEYPSEAQALIEAVRSRRDLAVVRGEAEDSSRMVKIKADALRADLAIRGGATYDGGRGHNEPKKDDSAYDSTSTELSAEFSLPWDRRRERNQYRQALIARDRAIRQYSESEDDVKNEVRSGYRNLVAMRALYGNKVEAYKTACMRVEANDLFTQSGRSTMRDILEAESALLSARNALCSAVIDWWTSDLSLRCATGKMRIARDGTWQ
ncbi:MAG: TolC family protein [Kiritimatiellae bacterium]|nr:TolC family protein [Kiritimatiellia bacterium]